MKKNIIITLLSLFILLSESFATTYYLDPVNGSMSNSGTSESPWKDLKLVLLFKTFNDGDSLMLRSGFHGFNFGISGYHDAPVVIKADEGHTPYMLKINILGSNWVLDGILFTPEWNRGYEIPGNFENGTLLSYDQYSHNNIVKNCEFRSATDTRDWSVQNWRDSVWSGIKDYGKDNISEDNHLKNVAYALTAMVQSERAIFRRNFVEIYSGDGIRNAGANYTVIEYNKVCNAVELDDDPFVGNHEDGIQSWGDTQGLIVRGNYIYSDTSIDTIPFIGPIQGIVIFDGSTTNALFENNVVVTEHWHGITVLGSYNSKYINNTILPLPNVSATQGPPWLRVDKKKDGTSSSGNIIRNNLATDLVIEAGSSVLDHNVISINANLFLNDYSNWDFTPKPGYSINGVKIIDAGSATDAPDRDIAGVVRPQGSGFDIGAYEYTDSSGTPLHTFYVDPINGSMQNNGSSENPWATLKEVMESKTFVNGDIILLRSGYHGNNILLSNVQSEAVTIKAEEGEAPVLLSMNIGTSNWIIDGLNFSPMNTGDTGTPGDFDNGKLLQLGTESSNNIIKNCNFYSTLDASSWTLQNWRDSVWSGVLDYGQHNVISNNTFTNIAYAVETNPSAAYTLVEKNLINHFSGDGIRIGSSDNCTVEYNTIMNQVELDADAIVGNHEDGIQAWNYSDGVDNLIIRGNYILNYEDVNQPFKGILQGIGLFDGFYNNLLIENNVVIVEHWHGISVYGAKNSKIINNTVLSNPGGSSVAGPPWIMINNHKDGTPSFGNIVRNNLSTGINVKDGSSIVDHNVITTSAINFVNDYNNFDFTPKPGYVDGADVAIIDAGSADDAPIIDILRVKRPQGNAFDIGAYELVQSSPIQSTAIPKLKDEFYTIWNVTPTHSPMDGVTGLSKGEVEAFEDFGILIRFKDTHVDANNGDRYQAENQLAFEAGTMYSIRVTANIKTQTYSAEVTPVGGSPIAIAIDYKFRGNGTKDEFNYFAMAINELEQWGGVPGSRLNPSFLEDNYELNFVENNIIEPQTETFTASFDIVPTAQRLNSAVSLLQGKAIMDGWGLLSAIVRLNDQNKFDVRDGSVYKADADLAYVVGTKYSVIMDVNVPAQTYTVSIMPEGGSEVVVATDYAFRVVADTITTFAQLTIVGGIWGGTIGEVQVTNFEITTTDISELKPLPRNFALEQNYPNPFNPSTIISFALPKTTSVKVIIYNVLGQKVAELINQEMKAGRYQVEFNTSSVNGSIASGLYFYSIIADNFKATKKMLLLK